MRTLADLNNNPPNNNGPNRNPFQPAPQGGGYANADGPAFTWRSIPMGFYLTLILVFSLFFVDCFVNLALWLVDIPEFTLLRFQLWRLLFPYLVSPDFLSLLITVFMLYILSMSEEIYLGTARYLLSLFCWNFWLQLLVASIGLLLRFLFGVRTVSFGIWPLFIVTLTLRCMKRPEEYSNFCCDACPVQNKYFPLVLLGVFLPFNILFGLQIDQWLAWGLAMLMSTVPRVKGVVDPPVGLILWTETKLKGLDGKLGKLVTESPFGDVGAGWQQSDNRGQQRAQAPGGFGMGFGQGQTQQANNGNNYNMGAQSAFGGQGVSIGGSEMRPMYRDNNNNA